MPVCIMVTILKSGLHLTGVFCVIGLEFLAPSPAVPGRPPPRKPTLRRGEADEAMVLERGGEGGGGEGCFRPSSNRKTSKAVKGWVKRSRPKKPSQAGSHKRMDVGVGTLRLCHTFWACGCCGHFNIHTNFLVMKHKPLNVQALKLLSNLPNTRHSPQTIPDSSTQPLSSGQSSNVRCRTETPQHPASCSPIEIN